MTNKLNWKIFSAQDRNKTLEALKDIISSNDGFIVDFNFFSDLALTLTIEIEERRIKGLHSAISQVANISELENIAFNPESVKDWWIFLNISFAEGTGELKVIIPEIPG